MKQPRPLVVGALVMLAVSMAGPADADAPAGHYIVSGTGNTATVYDIKSKLTWQTGGTLGTWAEGKAYCAGLGSTMGGTGWRMPTFKELMTLLDLSQTRFTSNDLKMDPVFPFSGTGGHWSATLDAKDKSKAWNINFFYGDTYTYGITNTNATRCVR
jgi:hypothetical protein